MIIDFHTHVFPDEIAENAIIRIKNFSKNAKSFIGGKISDLLKSMDEAGIEISVIQSIATNPRQVRKITDWSLEIKSERIIPFGSIHPDYKAYREEINVFCSEGIKGLKLHPMYQEFVIDDEKMFGLYNEIARNGLIAFFHSGYDMGFPGDKRADVTKLLRVKEKFPELIIVAAHFGGWRMWDEVYENIAGKDIYIETSFGIDAGYNDIMKKITQKHSKNKILFGTDSPWQSQKQDIEKCKNFFSEFGITNDVLGNNAKKLLGIN